ncbi:MAG TPA: HD-GYP domain-containing protein [Candidatus Saccharimonadales bacterium]|jgi:putative nucleotidyltransferase with HDIG domain|nr:HD-GYP domain-containing protein [Candidatus Saccharimonadales bacterium]
MRTLRPALRVYVTAVIVTGGGALGLGALVLRPLGTDLAVAAVLLVLATAAQLRPVHLTQKTKVTVEDAATFAAALLLDPALAMLVAAGSAALASLRGRMSWYNRAFNVSAVVLDTGAAAITFTLLAGGTGPSRSTLPAIAVAAILKFAVNSTVVDVAVALQLRRRPLAKWWARHRRDAAQLLSLYAIGAIGAASASDSPLTLALFVAPSALVLLALRNTARIAARTKQAARALAALIEQRDQYTYGHSQRVADYAERLARAMRMDAVQIDLIREAAFLHDIGKIATPDAILRKPGGLDACELEVMHEHAEHGYALLEKLPAFWEGAEFVRSHHERVDGTGYPRGLRGWELPLEVSVIAVADSYDAMTTDRVYRKALPWPAVRAELLRERGRQWHASVVDAFLAMIEAEVVEPAA